MRLLLIAGHGASDPGACSSYGIEKEEARRVVNEVYSQFKNYSGVVVDIYNMSRNAYDDVNNGNVQVDFSVYDYVFEIHFNSSANESANGVEVWVTPLEETVEVEQKIVNKISALGFTERGVKSEYFAVITSAKNHGISSALLETCFISNGIDMYTYNAKFKEVCNAIVEGIAEGFGLTRISEPVKEVVKEVVKVDYIIQYSNSVDKNIAEIMADRLNCPTIDCTRPYAYYSLYKTVISVGEGKNKSGYTNVNITGADRKETLKNAIAYLEKIGK